jgi:hypothetical protein
MKERLNLNMKTHVSKFSNIQFVAFLKGSFILGSAMLVLIVSRKEEFLTSLSIFKKDAISCIRNLIRKIAHLSRQLKFHQGKQSCKSERMFYYDLSWFPTRFR